MGMTALPQYTLNACSNSTNGVFDLQDIASQFVVGTMLCDSFGVSFSTSTTVVDSISLETAFNSVTDTVYAIVSSDNCLNTSWDTLFLVVNPIPNLALGVGPFCSGDLLIIGVAPASPMQSWVLEWQSTLGGAPDTINGMDNPWSGSVYNTDPSNNSFQINSVTNTVTGCANSNAANIVVNQMPVATVLSDTAFCPGEQLQIAFSPTGTDTFSLAWSSGSWPSSSSDTLVAPAINTTPNSNTSVLNTLTNNTTGCDTTSTISILIHPQPSFDTITSFACAGDTLIVSGISNANMGTYAWASSPQPIAFAIASDSASIISANNSMDPLHLVLQGACSLDTLLINIQLFPLPVALITNTSDFLDGQVSYCNGQQLVLSCADTNAVWTALDTAFLEPDMALGDSYEPMITSTGTHEIVLTVSRDSSGVVCKADTMLTVHASRSLCKISSLYQFPGYIFIASLDTTFNGNTPFFQWFNANDPLTLDTLASVGNAAVAIIPEALADSVIRVFGSYYGEGLCECSSERLNTKAFFGHVNELKVYPNPVVEGNVNMIMPSYFRDQHVEMQLIDLLGQSVLKLEMEPGSIFRTVEIPYDLDGIYLMELRSAAHVVSHKVIVR